MSGPRREAALDGARAAGGGESVRAGPGPIRCCGAGPSIVEVVVAPATLEVYERAGEGAVDVLEQKLRALGLRLSLRRRSFCG